MAAKKEFTYEIVRHVATVTEGGALVMELNLISYNGNEPKYDLRKWRTVDGNKKMQKGITLTPEELRDLRYILNKMGEI